MAAIPVSPLAPKTFPELPAIEGVRFATAEAGIKYKNRTDVLLMAFDEGTSVAGVLTRSLCSSAAVELCRENLPGGIARGLVVNSGNSNAFTGMKGRESVKHIAATAAKALGCSPSEVFIAQTGVIGELIDASKFDGVLDETATRMNLMPWIEPAKAIMTTDTYPKLSGAVLDIDGTEIKINGIAKGSGMIAPDMATMLSFVVTDMPIAAPVLQALLSRHVQTTFNAITVDSDTSTSDTLLVFATNKAAVEPIASLDDPRAEIFGQALADVLFELAILTVRDGEGATKQVSVHVEGAVSDESAFRIGKAIADSPLVKTAIAGEDANWGRVVMAVGKAGEPADRDKLSIRFGDLVVAKDGERAHGYDEAATSAYMKGEELELTVSLGMGEGRATIYTCDLTHGYITINGDYRS
ncbi:MULTISPECIES: bifunctional glutamate N-acetyltransferase/amino-acid acetyltransferase ArgJ [unclassified Devosia]|uniref:bifunctional glutamate N-acetyltransferase/amino-acid acetyltransferase ArgJ n=1 Tax=unclassified Devosia TaxID=196773 RepID=UPI0015F9E8C0|nr:MULTISPECIES: bifunctional glutamate N-acetyltransferase/amino-acid acetyltransferase ArgJ [unclassified Devosia]MBJ6987648.1 bifunctional glutamate N-acetyltransferase/amino-acid acetyltransferase ArgJ [Devosia sp. MC521]MBK1795346.1 bifunctional glutamate N-acetyltransferase/amino-acid acetyltransferase ArgJ [Devosia sp. WQ 349K1]QMW62334.1 bifunctional glutamate N-acetyltransferase/amino-acid acetyltransferase ArgJ [Devosia sp. MC521]